MCNKNYKSRVGLWGHKKTCGVEDMQQQDTQENNETMTTCWHTQHLNMAEHDKQQTQKKHKKTMTQR